MSIDGPDEHQDRQEVDEHQRARGFGGSAMSINRWADEHRRAGGHISIGALLGNYAQALGINRVGNMLLGSAQQLNKTCQPLRPSLQRKQGHKMQGDNSDKDLRLSEAAPPRRFSHLRLLPPCCLQLASAF